jgi:WD40 repeat protein
VHIWSSFDPTCSQNIPKKIHALRHRSIESQVYVCEPNVIIDNQLLTAADNQIFLWDTNEGKATNQWDYFPSSSSATQRPFGGEVRNPDNEAYVFDAKWRTKEPHIAGVALSDGTIRLLDTRQRDNSIFTITLQNAEDDETKLGHATSVSN